MAERLRPTIIITTFNDRKRVYRTFNSLLRQSRMPYEVIFADGGSKDGTMEYAKKLEKKYPFVRAILAPGNIAETRHLVIKKAKGDIIVFLDADQMAPRNWLKNLLQPIEDGEVDFAGGATRPFKPAQSTPEDYVNRYEHWFYENVVKHDVSMMPMGNTAWKAEIFRTIGGIRGGLKFNAEDYDVNQKVKAAGYRGKLVEGAWVYHDQSGLDSLRKILRRKYRYNTGAAYVYLLNNSLRERMKASGDKIGKFRHTYEVLDLFIKPLALFRAIIVLKVGV